MTTPDDDDFELVTTAAMVQPVALTRERVIVPEWKTPSGKSAAFYVTELTGTDYDEYQQGMFLMGEGADFSMSLKANTLRLLAYALVDPNGNRIYPDAARGITEIGRMGQAGIDRLGTVARRLNGLAKNSRKAAEGNSAAAPSGASNSVSPSPSVTRAVATS